MLFETIRCENGVALNTKLHETRMRKFSGKSFELSFLQLPSDGVYRCKLVYLDEIISVKFTPYVKREIKTLHIVESEIEYPHKFLDRREIDELCMSRAQMDDILIVKNGSITDTSIANVAFLDKNNNWLTPKKPLLHGTMRQKLLDEGSLIEADIHVEDLDSFEAVAIMNALRGFEPLGYVKDVIKF